MNNLNLVVTLSYGQVRRKAKNYQYWQPALYKIYTKKDGSKVWKYYCHLGVARRSKTLAIKDGIDICKLFNYRWSDEKIRNWYPL